MHYAGVIIEESLEDKSVLEDVRIVSTKVEPVTPRHRTPWVKEWTLHAVEVDGEWAGEIAKRLAAALDSSPAHPWYADYKTENDHYIIFYQKIFHITDRWKAAEYQAARDYAIALGIPEYQVNFVTRHGKG